MAPLRLVTLLTATLVLSIDARNGARAAQDGAASVAAAGVSSSSGPGDSRTFADSQVLVRFSQSASKRRRLLAAQPAAALAGLSFQQYVGRHHRKRPPAPAGGGAGAVSAAVAASPGDAVFLFAITDGSTVQQKVAQLNALPGVDLAEPNFARRVGSPSGGAAAAAAAARVAAGGAFSFMPDDPDFLTNNGWHLRRVAAPLAWATTKGSSNVKVCIIDTGLNRNHEEFTDGRVAKGWNRACPTCNNPVPGNHTPIIKPNPGTPAYFDFSDTSGHGTHVAGILAAATNNSRGVAGMSWQASLYICAVESPNGDFYTSSLLDCYSLCQAEGARVVSNSYYSDCEGNPPCYSQLEYEAIRALNESGALFVAAAGNAGPGQNQDALAEGRRSYPAGYQLPNVLSVAATDSGDALAYFSNYGKTLVHLAAPGVNVFSSYFTNSSSYESLSGTSMATPVVAGAAALLFALKPQATVAEVREALLASVDPLPALSNRVATGGRLNAARALAHLAAQGRPANQLLYGMAEERGATASLVEPAANCSVTAEATWPACKARCLASERCWYAVHAADGSLQAACGGTPATGSCLLAGMDALFSAPAAQPGHTLGFKSIADGPWLPPPPAAPLRRPPPPRPRPSPPLRRPPPPLRPPPPRRPAPPALRRRPPR